MFTTLTDIAKELDSFVDANGAGFGIQDSVLYGIKFTSKGGLSFVKSATCPDIYEMLTGSKKALRAASTSDAVGILSCGWAAPADDDDDAAAEVPPSLHPNRRRVRLLVVAKRNLNEVVSVVRFQDEPDNVIVEESRGRGPLVEAIHDLMNRANANAN
jgi:hypothetical protein